MKHLDEEMMRWLSREALRQATESISKQLAEMAQDPVLEGLSAREAVLAASEAILQTNDKQWGKKEMQP
jgi:hypothetical protein